MLKRAMTLMTGALVASMGLTTDAATITDNDASLPGDAFLSHADNASWTRVRDSGAGAVLTRGQTFITPDTGDANTQWGLTSITVQMRVADDNPGNSVPTAGSNPLRLQIVEWGADTQAHSPGTEIYNMAGDFPLNVSGGDFITIDLGSTLALNENANYGFLLSWDTSSGNDVFFAVGNGSASTYADGRLWIGNESSTNAAQDLTFYLHGTAVPEPGSLAFIALGGVLVLRRRRRH